MKGSYKVKIDASYLKKLTKKIDDQWGYANLLIESMILATYNSFKNQINANDAYMCFEVNKTSRLHIFVSNNKYLSIVFPFGVSEHNDCLEFNFRDIKISSKLLNDVLTLVNSRHTDSLLEILLGENDEPISDESFKILENILLIEPGYIRHDEDLKGAKGKVHPQVHFDINFSKNATYKIGLNKMQSHEEFISLFDKDSDCFYLK